MQDEIWYEVKIGSYIHAIVATLDAAKEVVREFKIGANAKVIKVVTTREELNEDQVHN